MNSLAATPRSPSGVLLLFGDLRRCLDVEEADAVLLRLAKPDWKDTSGINPDRCGVGCGTWSGI